MYQKKVYGLKILLTHIQNDVHVHTHIYIFNVEWNGYKGKMKLFTKIVLSCSWLFPLILRQEKKTPLKNME